MADHARQPQPGVSGGLAVRRRRGHGLLRAPAAAGARRAAASAAAAGPTASRRGSARQLRLGFAVHDVAALTPAGERTPARVTVALFGLFGPEGPMPLHLTPLGARPAGAALVRGRRRGRDQRHDLPRLRQRAAAPDARALLPRLGRPDPGGAGRARRRRADADDARAPWPAPARRRCAPRSSTRRRRSATRCSGRSGWPASSAPRSALPVRIEEFVGAWSAMPRAAADAPRRRPRRARPRRDARPAHLLPAEPHRAPHRPAGARRLSRLPARRRPARDPAPGAAARPRRDARRRRPPGAARADEVPAARLGAARLGRTAWLTPARTADARDLRLRAVVGLAAEGARAAA